MNTLARSKGFSPNVYARTGGVLYFILIALGIIQQMIRGKIFIPTNPSATGDNLRKFEMLWRTGIAIELVMMIVTTIICWIIYILTRRVNKNVALVAAFFYLVAIATQTVNTLLLVQTLYPASGLGYMGAFSQEQLNAMSSLLLQSHGASFSIVLLLCGPFFLFTAYLLYRSRYFPKFLGLVYIVPGIGYLVSSFLLILAPRFGEKYYFFFAAPAGLGELIFALWLMIKGVNLKIWNETGPGCEEPTTNHHR